MAPQDDEPDGITHIGPRRATYTPPVRQANPSDFVPGMEPKEQPAPVVEPETEADSEQESAPEPDVVVEHEDDFPIAPPTRPISIDQIPGITDISLDWSPIRKEPEAGPAPEDDAPPANVLYQLDDVEPVEPFGLPVEQLPPPSSGERLRPADETSADETSASETSADETSADETGADETGADEAPADDAPVAEPVDLIVDDYAVDAWPVDDSFVDEETTQRQDPEPRTFELPTSELLTPENPDEPLDEAAQLALLSQEGAPEGRPWIPERHSLRDDELTELVQSAVTEEGGALAAMEQLERQLALRDQEKREFEEWQESMLSVGTPEAIAAVEQVLPEFTDIVHTGAITLPPLEPAPAAPPVAEVPAFAPPTTETPVFDAPPPPVGPPSTDTPPPFPPALVDPPAHPSIARPDPWAVTPAEGVTADPAGVEPALATGLGISTDSIPIATGSLAMPLSALDSEVDDLEADAVIDATDRVGFDDIFPTVAAPATAPVLSPRIPEDEAVLSDPEFERPRMFSIERVGLEPTPEEQRIGRAASSLWLWFAANSSIAAVAFGGLLFSLGMSLRQAIVGVLAGVALSFIPIGLGILAGKRSSQPTMVASRAAFGVHGNIVPASIALVTRVFWGAALLWIAGQGVASILVGAQADGGLGHDLVAILATVACLLVALVVAVFGYGFIARLQLILSIVSAVLIVGLIALTAQHVDLSAALQHADGSWFLVGTTGVLVFSYLGLLWANTGGDLARYQRPGSSGAGSMLGGAFGATLPVFVLAAYGALLAASDPRIATGLLENPFDTLGLLLPLWYPAPLIAALVLGLISAVVLTIYSGGFSLLAIGVSLPRHLSAVIVGGAVLFGGLGLAFVGADFSDLFRDLATTIAVPVAAWVGIIAADTMIRSRPYDTDGLLGRTRLYGSVNIVTVALYVVITVVGLGLTTAAAGWLGWQGFLLPLIGVPLDSALAGTDFGVLVALLLGLLVPITTGIPAIRRQQAQTRRSEPGV